MALLICLGVFTFVGGVNTVKAATGTWGTATYELDDDGVFIFTGSGVLTSNMPSDITRSQIVSIQCADGVTVALPSSCYDMFSYCRNLQTIDLSGFDFTNVTDMQWMFRNCSKLKTLNWTNLNLPNLTSMQYIFFESGLEHVVFSNWHAPKLKDMTAWFYSCSSLQSVDLSGLGNLEVTNMSYLFNGCSSLKSVNLDGLNTSNVTDMRSMFARSGVESLDLSGFDTSKVTLMNEMFQNCSYLKYLDIRNFNTDVTWSLNNMFSGCSNLNTVVLSENFAFDGRGDAYKALLPTPSGSKYTGNWIREDGRYGPYTPAELRDNYTADMAGTWIWETGPCMVYADDETMYFIRPTADSTYTSGATGTVKSISGGEYTGVVYRVDERTIYSNQSNEPWYYGPSRNAKKVVFVDEISPVGTRYWFEVRKYCTYMDLSKLDTSKTTDMVNMFAYDSDLMEVKLGEKFSFKGNNITNVNAQGILPNPQRDKDGVRYTGKWIRDDKAYGPYTSAELRDNYTSEMAGKWIWELAPTEYTISFAAGENATGAMQSVKASSKEDFTLPANQFVAFGYEFDHWDDGNGKTYVDKGTISANTYAADQKVTLTAVFKKRDTSLNWDGNAAEFSIRAGEQAVLDNIPAGTSYQVYELTPDGWVLVQQENVSGVIEALEESAAAFWNKYQPGVTTVQFSGLKNLDGRPAEAGKFTFELYEGDTLVDTATTQDGGFIQFKVIEYDAAGDHVYTIREVDPNDDAIDYDTHEETVEVSVTDNGDGTLSSEVTYDDDGIVFSNATRPGTLRITKNAMNRTSQNANDEFTIEIEFRNESGMPINDNIYWYIEGLNVSEGESVVPEE